MRVFISHSSLDKRFVRTLKADLNENGISTFVDEDVLEIGDSLEERLSSALDSCTHFMIILTTNSVESDWVKFELNHVGKLLNGQLIQKIIPIKYRDCEIPEQLKGLIYEDLSNEAVFIDNDRVKFASEGYPKFIVKLLKTLKSTERKLSSGEKNILKNDVSKFEDRAHSNDLNAIRVSHKVIRFKDATAVEYYRVRIIKRGAVPAYKKRTLKPILFPCIYRLIFPKLKLGSEVEFININGESIVGHFAGFRNEDGFAIYIGIRKFLNIESSQIVKFSLELKKITFRVYG